MRVTMNNINFKASEVEYSEAIDGEIVQVSFDEDPEQDPFDRTKCYVMISHNYEFPGKPTVEWHDGENDDGGAEIQSYILTNNKFELKTNIGVMFKVEHECNKDVLTEIEAFCQREFS